MTYYLNFAYRCSNNIIWTSETPEAEIKINWQDSYTERRVKDD